MGSARDVLLLVGRAYLVLIVLLFSGALYALYRRRFVWSLLLVLAGSAIVYPIVQRQLKLRAVIATRLDAKARFEEHCKDAGEHIYRTVTGVEGVLIMRPRTEPLNYRDQYKLDDPYGYIGTGDDYIRYFVKGRATKTMPYGPAAPAEDIAAYQFAEIADISGAGYWRYTTPLTKVESEFAGRNGGRIVPLERTHVEQPAARYGVTWEDISTIEDRNLWIAGGVFRILDLKTNEVIAERVGYMYDPGQGNSSGGRAPWLIAENYACPPQRNVAGKSFIDRVIEPARE